MRHSKASPWLVVTMALKFIQIWLIGRKLVLGLLVSDPVGNVYSRHIALVQETR